MPFRIPSAIQTFNFRLSEARIPLAKVILLGGVRYVEVCPCCSCIHQLPMRHEGETFEPRCLFREWQRPDYTRWITKYPEAKEHTRVQLVTGEQWATLTAPPLEVVKKPRRTRKSKKAA